MVCRAVTLSPTFIRRTRTRRGNEDYATFRMVRFERVEAKVRQRTLLNFGRHFEVAPADWPRLCQRIEDILAGQLPLSYDDPAGLEEHAQRIAAQLLARARVGRAAAPDVQAVDVSSLALLYPRLVGVEQVALWALDQLGLRPIYHHKPMRAEGHLFITVIAYQLVLRSSAMVLPKLESMGGRSENALSVVFGRPAGMSWIRVFSRGPVSSAVCRSARVLHTSERQCLLW